MRSFLGLGRTSRKESPKFDGQGELKFDAASAPQEASGANPSRSRKTGRTEVYAVRVRETFKGEISRVAAEIQLERQNQNARARRVTEGEVMELMLEAFKAARRNGEVSGHAVAIADDVWRGAAEIARALQITPAEVVERLVVQKIAELGLLACTK